MTIPAKHPDKQTLRDAIAENYLILDGAMGTMIQARRLSEADYRGDIFTGHDRPLAGCNDLLCMTRPDIISDIHRQYADAGAGIITTNTFNANTISLAEYGLEDYAEKINHAAVVAAKNAIAASQHHVWIAGSMGPTNKSLSMTAASDKHGNFNFDTLCDAYRRQASALVSAGVDAIMIETIFDTLNAKAAIIGCKLAFKAIGRNVPLMLSVTLTEKGRTLSGQTIDAFITSVEYCNPLTIGLNCGFGPEQLRPYLQTLSASGHSLSFHPNAGLPDAYGNYTLDPADFAKQVARAVRGTNVRIAGGCCGTTPAHIAALAHELQGLKPDTISHRRHKYLMLSGLESMPVPSTVTEITRIGERCNVAGSRKFLRLIKENNLDEATGIARSQVEAGAKVLDINLDDGMLDAPHEMARFLDRLGADPTASAVPVMIDSSSWSVIEEGLKHVQGRCIVNSISLKDGENEFLRRARHIKNYGAAMVVMAMDEQGQADTCTRKLEISRRAFRLLTTEAGVYPEEIIFDPNVLTIATGIDSHAGYAVEFIKAAEAIKAEMPGVHVSGGISNLSFAFRGIDTVRKAMHAEFIRLAKDLDMAIVNPSAQLNTEAYSPELLKAVHDVILNTDTGATGRLTDLAMKIRAKAEDRKNASAPAVSETKHAAEKSDRLASMIVNGSKEGIDEILNERLKNGESPLDIVEQSLMKGMGIVGEQFGAGKIFLPQVVRSADAMQHAVDILAPHITASQSGNKQTTSAPTVVLATVKGDVHDIGKNIVGILLRCNGFNVIDLGTKQPATDIINRAVDVQADIIALSGLITPSLHEMVEVARMMEKRSLKIPLFVGGAATSPEYAATRIAPVYSGPVFHTYEAAAMPPLAKKWLDENTRPAISADIEHRKKAYTSQSSASLLSLAEARHAAPPILTEASDLAKSIPFGTTDMEIPLSEISPLINWRQFMAVWQIDASLASVASLHDCDNCRSQWLAQIPAERRGKAAEAIQLHKDALQLLSDWANRFAVITARTATYSAHRECDDIVLSDENKNVVLTIPTMRRQRQEVGKPHIAIADYVATEGADDRLSLFAVTVGKNIQSRIDEIFQKSKYMGLVAQALADRLAEAGTEWLHRSISGGRGIRPAIGYQSLPDQSLVFETDKILHYNQLGIELTENGAMYPQATTTGMFIYRDEASYFTVGPIGSDQFDDYTQRRNLSPERMHAFIRQAE